MDASGTNAEDGIVHYDLVNLKGLDGTNTQIIIIFSLTESRKIKVGGYRLTPNKLKIDHVEVDSTEFIKEVRSLDVPLKIKAYYEKENGLFEVVLDGKDFDFFFVQGKLQYDLSQNKIKLTNVVKHVYHKSNILYR